MRNKISIIIPAYNEEKYIEKTLKSIKKNNIKPEIIVVCDNCNDKTFSISKKHTNKVFQVNFQNTAKTRNFGAKKATGDILVFIDADTKITSNYLAEISKALTKYDYGVARWTSESKTFLGKYIAWTNNNYNKSYSCINGNFFVKTKEFRKMNGFNESILRGEDSNLGERLKDNRLRFIYIKNIAQIPSERKYRKEGYLKKILLDRCLSFSYMAKRKKYDKSHQNIQKQYYPTNI